MVTRQLFCLLPLPSIDALLKVMKLRLKKKKKTSDYCTANLRGRACMHARACASELAPADVRVKPVKGYTR